MSHRYGYAEKNCLFSMPSDLLLTLLTLLLKSHFPPRFQEYYERKPNAIKSFGLRIAPLLESANINTKNIQKHSFSDIPSWCITNDDDEFRFNDASTHEGHLRQNGELTWFCSETIIMVSLGALLNQIFFSIYTTAKKSLSDSHLIKQNFQELQSRLSDYQHIYMMAQKFKIRLAVRIYRAATMKRSVSLMAHLFSLLNPRLLI